MPSPFVVLPAFPAIAGGKQSITVAKNKSQTLAPGSYGKVRVSGGATLTLSGGLYQIASLDVDQSATVVFAAAVDLIATGDFGRMVCLMNSNVESCDISDAVGSIKLVDPNGDMVHTARAIGVSFGDR